MQAFQLAVNEYNIDKNLIEAFLKSMEMDLDKSTHQKESFDNYVFGSAEAVGLMCLKVFVDGNEESFKKLTYSARMLGSAFQKVNFLRDIRSDLQERGRIYLPGVLITDGINNESKRKLELEVENDFNLSLPGMRELPAGVKLGVYSAYLYYRALLKKIKRSDIRDLMEKRIRISNYSKLILLIKSFLMVKIINKVK